MFSESAPWLKDFPHYTPREHAARQNNWPDSRPLVGRSSHTGKQCRDGRLANYQFVVQNVTDEAEAPNGRLCKSDFKRLRRFQNHRMQVVAAFRHVAMTMLIVGLLMPLYVMTHAATVCAIAHKCSTLLHSALASSAIKTWLSTVRAT